MAQPLFIFVLLAFTSGTALAHPGHADGLLAGLMHPLQGVDHLLAMVTVGLWAARFRGMARLALPLSFVASMLLGALLGLAGVSLPGIELVIGASVIVLCLIVAARAPLPLAASTAIVAGFALFHGNAHFAELPPGSPFVTFAAGMLISTALLHAAGLIIALRVPRVRAWLQPASGATP